MEHLDKNVIDRNNIKVCCGYTTFVEYLNDAMFPCVRSEAYYYKDETCDIHSLEYVQLPRNKCGILNRNVLTFFHNPMIENPLLMNVIEGFRKEIFNNNLRYSRTYVEEVERLFCVSWCYESYINTVLPMLEGMYDSMCGRQYVCTCNIYGNQ